MTLWSTEHLVVTLSGPEGRREFVVPRPFARVGAHPASEIVLSGPGIAKRSHYLHATGDGLYCLDLDVEDADAENRGRWLAADDVLQVGPYQLTVRCASASQDRPQLPPPTARGSAAAPLPVVNVHCQRLLKDKRRFRARLNLVGRRPQCALQLRGSRVSAFHCALYWDQRRLWCVDLLSSNGTQLNGEKIDFAEMQLNDRLDVGEFSLVYFRWSPRSSMQHGWQPDAGGQEHDLADADDSAPAFDALSPPPPADASSSAAPEPALLREQLAGLRAADASWEQERHALESARLQAENERRTLSDQLAAAAQRSDALTAELAAAAAALAARQTEVETLAQRLAASEQAFAASQSKLEIVAQEKAAALARAEGLLAALPQQEQRSLQLAAEVARLAQERSDLDARLNNQIAELARERSAAQRARDEWQAEHVQLARQLAAESRSTADLQAALAQREAELTQRQAEADAARNDWQAERQALSDELAERGRQLAALQAELAAAAAQVAARQEEVARQAAPLESAESTTAAGEAEPLPLVEFSPAPEADDSPALDVELETPAESVPLVVLQDAPAGRRSKAQRHELTTFVGDRLIELDSSHRRRRWLLWGSLAAGTIALSAAILSVLYLLR